MARELAYAAILARLWPSWVMKLKPRTDSDRRWAERLPWILGVQSPAGWLAWRLSPEEYQSFQWVTERSHNGEFVEDRMPVLLMLAEGWEKPLEPTWERDATRGGNILTVENLRNALERPRK